MIANQRQRKRKLIQNTKFLFCLFDVSNLIFRLNPDYSHFILLSANPTFSVQRDEFHNFFFSLLSSALLHFLSDCTHSSSLSPGLCRRLDSTRVVVDVWRERGEAFSSFILSLDFIHLKYSPLPSSVALNLIELFCCCCFGCSDQTYKKILFSSVRLHSNFSTFSASFDSTCKW